MQPFRYLNVAGIDAALSAMSRHPQAALVAGGTALIDLMKLDVQTPAVLIDINNLPLAAIEVRDNGARIGALVRNSDLAVHPLVRERYPALAQALLAGASPQLRNRATVGGNLMQRTRCSYFRDTALACNKRMPGSGCGALNGQNRMHAILGTSDQCIATHPSDMAVALAALDAVIHTRGSQGERQITIDDFFLLPGTTPERETVLRPDELIVAVEVPATTFARRSLYLKVRDRASFAFALVSVAIALEIDEGTIRTARIALGGVAHKPWRAATAEAVLTGAPATQASFTAAATAAVKDTVPKAHNGFKVEMVKRTLIRTLTDLSGLTA